MIEIRRTFTDKDAARNWENRVLKKLKVTERNDYINMTNNMSIRLSPEICKMIGQKASKRLKGRKFSESHKRNMSISRLKNPVIFSEQARRKISRSSSNMSPAALEARSTKMKKKIWANDGKINRRFDIIPEGWTSGRINLTRTPMSEETRRNAHAKMCAKRHINFRGIEYLSLKDAERQTGVSRYLIKQTCTFLGYTSADIPRGVYP